MGGVGGVGSVSGAVGSGALQLSRDGIVGSWRAPLTAPTAHVIGDVDNLWRWAPWVRAQVVHCALTEPLRFAVTTDATPRAALWHAEPVAPASHAAMTGAASGPMQALFWMTRPTEDQFRRQLDWLRVWADLRMDRAAEIVVQIDDLVSFLGTITFLSASRTPRTLELLSAIHSAVISVEHRFKNAMAARRPIEYSAQVQPMIQTPGHSAYPSGHATESHALALALASLASERALGQDDTNLVPQLRNLAYRISQSRTVAGVHFPVDSQAGAGLGMTLARYFVARMQAAAGVAAPIAPVFDRSFDGEGWVGAGTDAGPDFDPSQLWADLFAPPATPGDAGAAPTGPDAVLGALWQAAVAEWG